MLQGNVLPDPRAAESDFGVSCLGPEAEAELAKEEAAMKLMHDRMVKKKESADEGERHEMRTVAD